MKRPRPPSIRVERDVALRMLGWSRCDVDLDHEPALGLRAYDETNNIFTPAADDPDYLIFRPKEEHRRKTSGTGATSAGSDVHLIAKSKRLAKGQEAFRARLLAKQPGTPRTRSGKIPSRPFQGRYVRSEDKRT